MTAAEEPWLTVLNACLSTDECECIPRRLSVVSQSISEHRAELAIYMCALTTLSGRAFSAFHVWPH